MRNFHAALEVARRMHEAEVKAFAARHGMTVEEAEEAMCLVEAIEEE